MQIKNFNAPTNYWIQCWYEENQQSKVCVISRIRLKVKALFWLQLEHLACSCGSPSAPPSWLYEREVNPDSYWITGFSIHMQAPPATQLCDSGGLSVLWKVFTGPCWCGADIYSGGGNEDSSTQVERLDCSELPEGPLSHWIQCAKFIPPEGSTLVCLFS